VRPTFKAFQNWNCRFVAALLVFVASSYRVLGIDANAGDEVARLNSQLRGQLKDGEAIDKRKANERLQVAALVAIINDESKPNGDNPLKHRALRELGRFPESDEAIDVLLREIRFEPPKIFAKDALATYPAADVLSKMGTRARTRLLKGGLNKPLSQPELYVRGVVLVKMDEDSLDWNLAKEITLKRLRHLLETVEKQDVPGDAAAYKAANLFNLKGMISLIDDPRFSARRISDPDVP
jgi:hypothetical protein